MNKKQLRYAAVEKAGKREDRMMRLEAEIFAARVTGVEDVRGLQATHDCYLEVWLGENSYPPGTIGKRPKL